MHTWLSEKKRIRRELGYYYECQILLLCMQTLEAAVNESGANPKYASNDCLLGLFIPILLTQSLGFPSNSTAVTLAKKIAGERIGEPSRFRSPCF